MGLLGISKVTWRVENKRGGLDVIGEPNSGKTFTLGALLLLFPTTGYVRPNKTCLFNWDHCKRKAIVCAEECRIDFKKDHETIEVLKDILYGNRTLIREKGIPSSTLDARPWIFLSNYDNFNSEDTSNANPFNTRLYRLKVKLYPYWAEKQKNLHWNALLNDDNVDNGDDENPIKHLIQSNCMRSYGTVILAQMLCTNFMEDARRDGMNRECMKKYDTFNVAIVQICSNYVRIFTDRIFEGV